MTFLSYLKDARGSIISNKLRSFLSMLGIVIGVSSVIILMAIGAGTQQSMLEQMSSLINNNITLSAKGWNTVRTNEDIKGYVKAITLTPELAQEIETTFSELSGKVTYGTTTMGSAGYDGNMTMSSFAGVPADYLKKMGLSLEYGRDFDQLDFDNATEVAIVNKNVIEMLFTRTTTKNPLGEKITINNKEYTIIGTLSDSSIMGQIFIPLQTYWQKVAGNKNISEITIKLDTEANNTEWQAKIQYFLLRKFNVKHLDLAGFSLSSTAAAGDIVGSMMTMMNIFLGAIGGISLLVGGIGVMNIMLVSVTERTREIWIRKAIGALNKDIIQQFLIESIVVTIFGGIIAIGFSLLIAHFVNNLEIEQVSMYINSTVVVTAFTLTLVVGVLSGILPARRAANLKPIDALRFE